MMNPCPVFPVIGTITAVGPSMLDEGGVLCRYIEISETGGKLRRPWVDRADGPRQVDFEAMRAYAQQRGRRDAR